LSSHATNEYQKSTHQTNKPNKICPVLKYSDTQTRTPGIIDNLHYYYMCNAPKLKSFKLCPHVDHFQASFNDKTYGCGYLTFK